MIVGLSARDPDSQSSLSSLFALPSGMACSFSSPALHLPLSGSHRNLHPSSSSSSSLHLACHGPLSSNTNPLTLSATPDKLLAKWRTSVSFFPSFIGKRGKSTDALKEELFEAIAPLDRGAEAFPEDQEMVDRIARQLEAANSIKEPLKSDLLNGKWELLYTTSSSILQSQRPKFLRPNGKIYQAINVDTLRAQNMETWPYFNQVTANLVPINARRVAVRFDTFKIFGLIPIKAPGRGRGELEITYLDEEIRISRGDKGNLFILKMVDRSYRIPV